MTNNGWSFLTIFIFMSPYPLTTYAMVEYLDATTKYLNAMVEYLDATTKYLNATVEYLDATTKYLNATVVCLRATTKYLWPFLSWFIFFYVLLPLLSHGCCNDGIFSQWVTPKRGEWPLLYHCSPTANTGR